MGGMIQNMLCARADKGLSRVLGLPIRLEPQGDTVLRVILWTR